MQNGDQAARLRAAFAYAKLTKQERADALGVGVRHVTRYESGETPVPTDRWEAVLAATGVPRWFLKDGFAAIQPQPDEPTTAERLEALERKVGALVRRLGGDDLPEMPDELRQHPGARTPSADTARSGGRVQDSDVVSGTTG